MKAARIKAVNNRKELPGWDKLELSLRQIYERYWVSTHYNNEVSQPVGFNTTNNRDEYQNQWCG